MRVLCRRSKPRPPEQVDTVKNESTESLADAYEEVDEALSDLNTSVATISCLQGELAAMRETTAKAAGRLDALAGVISG